jgi:hypothetical protein
MKRLEFQQILELYDLYKNGMTMRELASSRDFSEETIRRWFIENGLNTKLLAPKPKFDYTYFHNINTTRKAYYLGFLYADGSICKNDYRISIFLQDRDCNIIKSLHSDLKSQTNIQYREAFNNRKAQYGVYFNSKDMYYDLINLGIKDNKSIKGVNFPSIDSYLIPHFIRGFFDGDGTVGLRQAMYKGRKNGINRNMKFTCTCKSFIEKLSKEIYLGCGALGSIKEISNYSKTKSRATNIYNLIYWRVSDLKSLYAYLYNNSDICLERKRLKMEQAMLTVRESLELKS